ncbi:MAG TPA: succinate dehydrogenase/fumarate reductase iron-sulfur subunit, partial [Chitinophagaceae bacterium]
ISSEMSFLEMFDVLNEELIRDRKDPIAFDHDCREGICGTCSMYINGRPHGPWHGTTTCQLHMRAFKDGDTIVVEPWRAKAFPVIKDLIVDRSAFDRIIQAGGYISVNTGVTVDGNTIAIEKENADKAFAAAACIGCGACVAACKNSSALLFLSAKVAHLSLLPQGGPERKSRALNMVAQMDKEGFGACTNTGACEAVCPKEISIENIARLNKEYALAGFSSDK